MSSTELEPGDLLSLPIGRWIGGNEDGALTEEDRSLFKSIGSSGGGGRGGEDNVDMILGLYAMLTDGGRGLFMSPVDIILGDRGSQGCCGGGCEATRV